MKDVLQDQNDQKQVIHETSPMSNYNWKILRVRELNRMIDARRHELRVCAGFMLSSQKNRIRNSIVKMTRERNKLLDSLQYELKFD